MSPQARSTRPASTKFEVKATVESGPDGSVASLVELRPATGRMHQLRAHAALAQVPIFGDRTYGSVRQVVDNDGRVHPLDRVALHAWRIVLPASAAEAPIPDELLSLWRTLGGKDGDWEW